MKIEFDVTDEEARRAKALFDRWSQHGFVAARIRRNVNGEHLPPTDDQFWVALASALLTTQQRSGPDSPITALIRTTPFPLRLDLCRSQHDLGVFVEASLKSYRGIRRGPTIGRELAEDLRYLDGGGWPPLLGHLENLGGASTVADERRVARHLAENLSGVGPKQARNILQMLGLTRFETPIDSRVVKWLNSFGFPIHLSAFSLSDPDYYEFIEDGFQAICRGAGVLPCLLDAVIFASYDNADYDEDVKRW